MGRRAVFLDRDGVLIRDVHLLTQQDQAELQPGTAKAIALLQSAGFALVVVTNQSVVARGLAMEVQVEAVHSHIQEILRQAGGAEIERFFFCPHHPDANLPKYRVNCQCRKPRPGMLLKAADELDLELSASFMVGDRASDVAAGTRAGCRSIFLQTGMHDAPPIESPDSSVTWPEPDYTCADLKEAVDIIVGSTL